MSNGCPIGLTGRKDKTMKKYKIREGSIADYARIIGVGALFWGILFALAVQSYPM